MTPEFAEDFSVWRTVGELNRIVRPVTIGRYDSLGHLAYDVKAGLGAPDPQLPDPPREAKQGSLVEENKMALTCRMRRAGEI